MKHMEIMNAISNQRLVIASYGKTATHVVLGLHEVAAIEYFIRANGVACQAMTPDTIMGLDIVRDKFAAKRIEVI